jgi:hypothetical protein
VVTHSFRHMYISGLRLARHHPSFFHSTTMNHSGLLHESLTILFLNSGLTHHVTAAALACKIATPTVVDMEVIFYIQMSQKVRLKTGRERPTIVIGTL